MADLMNKAELKAKRMLAIFLVAILVFSVFVIGNVSATIFFQDDMESGPGTWTSDGLWHQTTDRANSPTNSWVYNNGVDYDTGFPNQGNLTTPVIDLTLATIGNLTFWTWHETEGSIDYDQMWVQISENSGPFINEYQIDPSVSPLTWIEITLNITSHVGNNIQIRFFFDSINDLGNGYEGWYIDDVEVNDNPVPPPPASLAPPPYTDFGYDENGNGMYDYLVVNVTVDVISPGNYYLDCNLLNETGATWITGNTNFTFLDTGLQVVPIMFYGLDIYNVAIDGPYNVTVELWDESGMTLLGFESYQTGPYLYIDFGPPAMFEPPYSDFGVDTNGDPYFNYLVVNVSVNVSADGWYDIYGDLNGSGGLFVYASNYTYLTKGTNVVQLYFEGVPIYQQGINETFEVNLWLDDDFGNPLDTDLYTTGFYNYTDFQPPGALLDPPPYSDYGLDADGDGLFNFLVVNVTVNVTTPGFYEVGGLLVGNVSKNFIDYVSNYTFLTPGPQVVQLYFSGIPIYNYMENETFDVDLSLYDEFYNLLDNDFYTTGFYNWTDFGPPGAAFEPPHSDFGLDTDGDGLFNLLVVNVTVNVTTPGWYTVDGSMYGTSSFNWTGDASNYTYLDKGLQVVQLYFGGSSIYNNMENETFDVYLDLYDDFGNNLDFGFHQTGFYNWTDFQPPGAFFEPPYSDYGLDTDSDSLFNYLVVNVTINVTEAGTYTVFGLLIDPSSDPLGFAANTSYFDVGSHTVQLRYNGMTIYNNSENGIYTVMLFLYDEFMNEIDNYMHMTNPYNFIEFQPPPAGPWATASGMTSGGTNNPYPFILYDYGNDPSSVEIYWSDDGGLNWIPWGNDASVDGMWSPPSPLPAYGTYYWNVQAIGPPDESPPIGPGDIEAGPYVLLDMDAPFIVSTTPLDGQTGVSNSPGTYVIEFSEPMDNGSLPLTDLPGINWTWDPSGLWLNGTYTALNSGTTYYVDLTGLGFQDLAGNPLSGDTYMNFTTSGAANPSAFATGPISTLTNNATPDISYNFANTPSSVEIYWSNDGGANWFLWGTDALVGGTWTPPTQLPASGTYYWSARAMGPPNEPQPNSLVDIESGPYVLDIDSPTIISTTPPDGASGVSNASGVYVIAFNESMANAGTPTTDLPGISWIWDPSGLWLNGTYSDLAFGTTYFVDLSSGFTDLAGNPLTGDMVKNFTTTGAPTPFATATGPTSSLTNNPSPTITYNFGNGPTSVEIYWSDDGGLTWTLWGSDSPVDGSWSAVSPLPASGSYNWSVRAIGSTNESVPNSPTDIEVAGPYVLDIDAPNVILTTPLNAAVGVLVNQNIIIDFNETMNNVTFTYTVSPNPGGLTPTWSNLNTRLTIAHSNFNPNSRYWVNITVATDAAGNNLMPLPYSFYFDTVIVDLTPPNVTTKTPTGTSVVVGSNIVITFNEEMNKTSVSSAFRYTDGTTVWNVTAGTVSWNAANTTFTFNPTANFAYLTQFTVTVNGSIAKDLAGNTLDGNANGTSEGSPTDDYKWQFTTEAQDTNAPTSSVTALPSYTNSRTFDITYTASDDVSGVKEVELWYNKDGAGWVLYNTYSGGSNTVSFTADSDSEYQFYTRAKDNNNNYETAPGTAQTTTIVDTVIPTVISLVLSDPSPTKAGIVTFTITFSEDMDTTVDVAVNFGKTSPYNTYTVTKTSYTGTTWTGTFTITATTGNGQHTIVVTLAEDLAGNQIAQYTTQFVVDAKAPEVTQALPTGTAVPVTTTIAITFDEGMNVSSVQNAFSFTDGTTTWTVVDGSVSWSGNTMTFIPGTPLGYSTEYTVTVGTGAMDTAGNAIVNVYSWSFTTQSIPDTTPPSINTVSLTGNKTEITDTLTITFSEPMDHAKVEAAITITGGAEIENFTWVGNTLTIKFKDKLDYGTKYTVTIGTGAEDAAGNQLSSPYSWSFTTKEKKEEPTSNVMLLLLLVIIVIVILVALVLMKKKGKPEEIPSEEPPAGDVEAAEEEEALEEEGTEPEGELPEEPQEEISEGEVSEETEEPSEEAGSEVQEPEDEAPPDTEEEETQ